MKKLFNYLLGQFSSECIIVLAKLAHRIHVFRQYQPIPDLNLAMDMQTPRNINRLKAIREHVPDNSRTGIDIGCNIGYFLFELANSGYRMIGIEGDLPTYRILNSIRNTLKNYNVITSNYFVTPENVDCLPEADFIICMAIFHHWCVAYGDNTALEMLKIITHKCRKAIFFETPFAQDSSDKYKKVLPDRNADDAEQWWQNFFVSMGCEKPELIYSSSRKLFVILPRNLS